MIELLVTTTEGTTLRFRCVSRPVAELVAAGLERDKHYASAIVVDVRTPPTPQPRPKGDITPTRGDCGVRPVKGQAVDKKSRPSGVPESSRDFPPPPLRGP